jgi:helicase required for RNAi-mediated heterochromatin assembly 1
LGVYTVDKFQGEENDIVLLSLVRSNWYNEVGFLDNKNRLVVALSRARRGLYIFGNAHTLTGGETHGQRQGRDELWGPLIRQMSSQGRLATSFPITCSKHSNVVHIAEAKNWDGLNGGCREKCDGVLECGHDCIYYCHPYDHRLMVCQADCSKKLRCGHMCSEVCGDQCRCARCSVQTRPAPVKVRAAVQTRPAPVQVRAVVHADRSTNPGSGVHGSSGLALLDLEDNHRNHGSEAGHQPNVEDRAKALLRWNAFDAEKDDAERHEKAMIARANLPQNETTVIRDTWKPISVVDGARIVHRAETTTIPQYNVKSPTNPKGNTTEQSLIDVSDDLTQLDLSNANRPHNEIHSFSDLCELMTPSEQEIDLYGASPPRPPPRVLHGPQNAGTGAGPVAPQMSLLDTDPEELSFELLQPEKKIQ